MKSYKIAVLGVLMGALILVTAVQIPPGLEQNTRAVGRQFQQDWESTSQSLLQLRNLLGQENPEIDSIHEVYRQARISYKKSLYWAHFVDPDFQADYINGPPLPRLERNFSQSAVWEPRGFQPLEELLFAQEFGPAEREEARRLCTALHASAQEFGQFHDGRRIEDYQVIEAVRLGLIRWSTLDLAGFDAPASGYNVPELRAAWAGMERAIRLLLNGLEGADETYALQQTGGTVTMQPRVDMNAGEGGATNAIRNVLRHFRTGAERLEQEEDFEAIDRVYYIREVVDPLFASLLDLQRGLELPESARNTKQKQSIQLDARSLFDEQLINPYFYMQLVQSSDGTALRELGRLLFFDPILSSGLERACASCHQPDRAFADGLPKSVLTGMQGTTRRNAPGLINSVYSTRFFWDLRVQNLENQFAHVVVDPGEFNSSVLEVIQRLSQSSEYRRMFADAFPQFGANAINPYTLNSSLASYVASLSSYDSPFDRYMRRETATIDPQVRKGFNLFMGKALCGTCHFVPVFSGLVPPYYRENESEVLGVPDKPEPPHRLDPDLGRGEALPRERHDIYRHAFKTVGIRNVQLTAPYMHNGAYSSLEEVMEFYRKGGGQGLGFEVPNQTLPFDSLDLNGDEVKAIVMFMNSLTDTAGLTAVPDRLPRFEKHPEWNKRAVGGDY